MFLGWACVCAAPEALPRVQMWAAGAACPSQGWPPSCWVPCRGAVCWWPSLQPPASAPATPNLLLRGARQRLAKESSGLPLPALSGQTWWVMTEVLDSHCAKTELGDIFHLGFFFTSRKKKEEKKIPSRFSGTKMSYEFMPFPLSSSFRQGKSTQ